MRRLAFALPLASILLGILLLFALMATIISAQGSTPGATPSALATPEQMWPTEVPENEEGTPLPVPYVTKVTMPPGSVVEDPEAHLGPFVLIVSEGAICYEYTESTLAPNNTTVRAYPGSTGSIPAGCEDARNDCGSPAGCILNEGDIVYLPSGSWVSQSKTGNHRYWTVGTENAVVYVTGYWAKSPGTSPGCGGGCPHP
jgi:hypothetical protein